MVLVMLLIPALAGYYYFGYNVGTLTVAVTDDAIQDFDSLTITFSQVSVHSATALTTDEWVTVTLATTTVDLTTLTGDVSETIGLSQVQAGKYTMVRILVETAEGVLKNGQHVGVRVPGGELRTETPFELQPQGSATLVVRLLVIQAGNDYSLQPALGSVVTGP